MRIRENVFKMIIKCCSSFYKVTDMSNADKYILRNIIYFWKSLVQLCTFLCICNFRKRTIKIQPKVSDCHIFKYLGRFHYLSKQLVGNCLVWKLISESDQRGRSRSLLTIRGPWDLQCSSPGGALIVVPTQSPCSSSCNNCSRTISVVSCVAIVKIDYIFRMLADGTTWFLI